VSTLQRDPDERVQVLDEAGRVREGVDVPDLTEDELVEMYEQMRLVRRFDERAVSLQRQGRMGTYPPLSGQEAAQVGSAHALADDDWVFPSYREHGVGLVRGLSLERTLLYWMGHEQGNYMPEDVNIFSVAVPIATQIPTRPARRGRRNCRARRRPSSATSVTGPRQRATSTRG